MFNWNLLLQISPNNCLKCKTNIKNSIHSYFHDQRWTWYFLRSYFHDQIRPGFLWTYFVSFETRENTKWDQNKSNVDGPNVHVPFVFTRSKVDMFYMGTKMATRSFWCLFVKVYTIKVGPKQNTAFILLFSQRLINEPKWDQGIRSFRSYIETKA